MENYILNKILNDNNISTTEKLLMIYLVQENGNLTEENCFVNSSNEDISKRLNCSKTCASLTTNSLIKKGYLEVFKFDGRTRTLKIKLLKK